MLKFAANVSMMFPEVPTMVQRISKARDAGFKAVEITVPYKETKEDLAKALCETGLECVLLNSWPGFGNEGTAANPKKVDEFKEKLEVSIDYAKALKCPRLHVISGLKDPDVSEEEAAETYVKNIQYAAQRFKQEKITASLEFINTTHTCPGYFLDSPEKALSLIKKIHRGSDVQLQMDIFHLQIIKGDLTNNIKKLLPHTGYIQVSQVPDRGEPGSPGEINYSYVFDLLKKLDYKGWIGLEYFPKGKMEDSLELLKQMGCL